MTTTTDRLIAVLDDIHAAVAGPFRMAREAQNDAMQVAANFDPDKWEWDEMDRFACAVAGADEAHPGLAFLLTKIGETTYAPFGRTKQGTYAWPRPDAELIEVTDDQLREWIRESLAIYDAQAKVARDRAGHLI